MTMVMMDNIKTGTVIVGIKAKVVGRKRRLSRRYEAIELLGLRCMYV